MQVHPLVYSIFSRDGHSSYIRDTLYLDDARIQSHIELGGSLQFEHVWLKYAEDGKYVLKDISFTISEEEKVL